VNTDVEQALVFFGCLVVAVILHEISHGVVALWFGDRTAKEAGRLTLNPVPHIDPLGSIVLPAMGAILGVPVIAWAKPVPVNPNRLHNPRRDMLVVSLAGPATNFILMVIAALAARAAFDPSTVPFRFGIADLPLGVQILFSFALVNLFLGLFNLLPIPPLDGSAIIERALPGAWLPHWYKFRPYGFLVLFLLVFSTGIISEFLRPFENRLVDFVFLSGR
jgi:Zn-dependent protease